MSDPKPSVHFHTLGCRLNQAESEQMAQGFKLAGYRLAESAKEADIRVINTCTVTREAGKKSRKSAKSLREGQRIVVTGCHSEVHAEEFKDADLIVSSADKETLVALTQERFGMEGPALGMDFRKKEAAQVYPLVLSNTRAFVKIQDGCDLRCSFCLTTVARGASRCRSVSEILAEVKALAEQGCKEVVLTGVHAGSYQFEDVDLADLMEQILLKTDIPRLRLSSLEPWNFKRTWVRLWAAFPDRICRHLHMSLQSGSDSVLRRMRRHYTGAIYKDKIDTIRNAVPDMAITTDIIVGFPGETDEEHAESLQFVKELQFADAHVFSYSARPGTDAAKLPNRVPPAEKKKRYDEMTRCTKSSREQFVEQIKGKPISVLWEKPGNDGQHTGLSDHYITVVAPENVQTNTIQTVTSQHREKDRLICSLK